MRVRPLLCCWALGLAFLARTETETVRVIVHVAPVRGILTENSAWPPVPSFVMVEDGERLLRVPLARNITGRPFHIAKGSDLVLRTLADPAALEDGQDVVLAEAPFLVAAVPEDAASVLLVLKPGEGREPGTPGYSVYDVSDAKVPVGKHTFLNTLENPVQIRMGEGAWLVEPAGRVHVEGEAAARARIFVQEIDGDGGRRLTTAVFLREGRGALHVLSPDPRSPRRMQSWSYFGAGPDPGETPSLQDAGENGEGEAPDPEAEEAEENEDAPEVKRRAASSYFSRV